MIDHDHLFKELLSTFFVEFFDLFFPQVIAYFELGSIFLENTELSTDVTAGERYEVDLIAKARLRGKESFFLIHAENQAYPQVQFRRQMLRYFARLSEKFALPVYPVVIYSSDAPRRPEPNIYRVEFPDKVVLELNYEVIQLSSAGLAKFPTAGESDR